MSLLLLFPGGAVVGVSANGTWEQPPAAWDAAGTVLNPITSTATFEQPAAGWAAEVVSAEDVTATGTWVQAAAAWSGVASSSVVAEPEEFHGRAVRLRRRVSAAGAWEQAPGAWGAVATVTRRPDDLEDLLLLDAV